MDGAHVQPVAVAVDDSDLTKPNRIRVVVAEGRNREVRAGSLLGKALQGCMTNALLPVPCLLVNLHAQVVRLGPEVRMFPIA